MVDALLPAGRFLYR